MKLILVAVSGLLVASCSAPQNAQGEILRVRAATDEGCAIADVEVKREGERTYVLHVCGKTITYTCDVAAYCTADRAAKPAASAPAASSAP